MPSRRPAPYVAILLILLVACNRGPSTEDALAAIRLARPRLDSARITERVWEDGPPWFSCAEVIAKFRSAKDSQVVRDQVGNWRPLVVANWISLHDTLKGPVVDPGWCVAHLGDSLTRTAGGWRRIQGPETPTGTPRRGWDVPAGRSLIVVTSEPKSAGKDSAVASYAVTVAPNANGVALASGSDSTHYRALLIKDSGTWRMAKDLPPSDSVTHQ